MIVRSVPVPSNAAIHDYLPEADFADAYEVVVPARDISPEESFHAIMKSMPDWFRNLFKLRNKLVRPFGLIAPTSNELDAMVPKEIYELGDRIGVFEFYGRADKEVITGADDKHLNFRLSVLRVRDGGKDRIVVTTLVQRHNLAGRIYLRSILPFHELGVRSLLHNAADKGLL
ncbi:MAG: DUF2867 domain-containing protein [Parasphingorhabdus sp.]